MAYVDTRPHELAWSPRFAVRLPIPAAPLLQRVERDVLLASRHDRSASLKRPGPIRRWIGRLFGFAEANRLADPRLEALRRFAVLLRRKGDRLPAPEESRLLLAGFSPTQMIEIRRLIEGENPPRRPAWKRRYLALVALVFAVEAVIFRLASAYFSDGLVGFAFTLTMLVAGTPLFGLLRRGPAPAPR
ncbi:hypothetical protein DMC47_31330 [Nostoc sp. 3335mG]|nr:hypothetical protein DMC47_31330 [Nostoc sp. 3335mG]